MMIATLRSSITVLVLLVICQSTIGGFIRQTISSRNIRQSTDVYFGSPILVPDSYVVLASSTDYLPVFSNDILIGLDFATFQITEQPTQATATLHSAGESVIIYTVDSTASGWDSFTYSLCKDLSTCYSAKVLVYTPPSAQGPTANNDFATVTDAPHSISIDVLSNDFDSDGLFANYASLVLLDQPEHGNAYIDPVNHQIVYTPVWTADQRFVGLDTIYYQICDETYSDLCSIASVGITVLDNSPACEACSNYESAFDAHMSSIRAAFHSLDSITL